jgi:tetratricopeptide (TPR) repeat protein
MNKRLKYTIAAFLLLGLIFVAYKGLANGNKNDPQEEYYHNLGLELFREGYFELIPQGKSKEGNQKLEQAVSAFEAAISINDQHISSHYYLARIFVIQKKFEKAAASYQRVIDLEPENIDNYLFLASVYVQMKRFYDAQKVLDYAKTIAQDPQVVERIESLVKSIKDQEMTP